MIDPGPVLVVDDDDDTRESVRELLEQDGYDVVAAADGRAALEYLTAPHNSVPSLIILDLSMPTMTGWELLAITKGYVRLASIPVVLLSGADPQLDPLKHGTINAFLRKPYKAEALLTLVRSLAQE